MPLIDFNIRLGKSIAWSTVSRFAAQLLAVASNLILARSLGVAGFGEYAFISAVVLIGNAITTFGTDMVLIRKISAEKVFSDLSASLAIQIFFSIIFISIVFSMRSVFLISPALLIYIFSLIPLSFFTIATIALRGTQQFNLFSILHFAFVFFQFIAACILFATNGNMIDLALLFLATHVLSALLGIVFCSIKIDSFIKHLKFSLNNILPLLRESFPLAVIGSLRLIYEKLIFAILPIFADLSTAGLYSASARILDATKLGYISALTPIYSEMARDKKFLSLQTGLRLLLFSAAFISLIIFLLAKPIIIILFADEFASSIVSLQIISWVLIPYIIVSYYSLGFVALEIEKPVLISLCASLLWLTTMLVILNQLYGLHGAALAVLSAEIVQAALLYFQWRKYALPKLSQ